jgi:hypothetical protein
MVLGRQRATAPCPLGKSTNLDIFSHRVIVKHPLNSDFVDLLGDKGLNSRYQRLKDLVNRITVKVTEPVSCSQTRLRELWKGEGTYLVRVRVSACKLFTGSSFSLAIGKLTYHD